MSASYPGAVKTFATRSAGQTIGSAHINDLQDEVNAIESGILNGTAPVVSSNLTVGGTIVGGFTERGRTVKVGEWSTYAANYGASSGTWQVTPATLEYTLIGKTMILSFNFATSTLSAANASVTFGLPSTHVATRQVVTPIRLTENSSESMGIAYTGVSSTSVTVQKPVGSLSSGIITVQGLLSFQING